MSLKIALLFHFNQHLSEYAFLASRTCYRGLLRVLRNHPQLPINIHISGTLLQALQWLDPKPIYLIQEGLADGQFELVGSTYAQNVPYSCDDWDNSQQIALHQRLLANLFETRPDTFWNPERCWRQSLLPIISEAGYQRVLMEDHILAAAGLSQPVTVQTEADGQVLTCVWDDERLKHLFNLAAWLARPEQLHAYLDQRAAHPQAHSHCLAYAEDAEAMGLWGWQQGVVPNQTWQRLDQLLSQLESRPDIQLIHLRDAPPPSQTISPIPDGAAAWMNAALQREDAPYHEDGYEDWFDFDRRSPKLAHYRHFFASLRQSLQPLAPAGVHSAPTRFAQAALHNYLSHQYELGCIGIGGHGFGGWEGAQASHLLLRVAQWAVHPQPFTLVEDINHDGLAEYILSDGQQLLVGSPAGGRLLYWFDLNKGLQWFGNQLAVTFDRYEGDGALPGLVTWPYSPWLPPDAAAHHKLPEAKLTQEMAPTRFGRFLPDWVWKAENGPFELLTHQTRLPGTFRPLPARRRGLLDLIILDGDEELPAGEWLEAQFSENRLRFTRPVAPDLTLYKTIWLEDGAIWARYEWQNDSPAGHLIRIRIVNELAPDYETVVRSGRDCLDFVESEREPGVVNVESGYGVYVTFDRPVTTSHYDEAFLSLELGLTWQLELPPQTIQQLTLSLRARPDNK